VAQGSCATYSFATVGRSGLRVTSPDPEKGRPYDGAIEEALIQKLRHAHLLSRSRNTATCLAYASELYSPVRKMAPRRCKMGNRFAQVRGGYPCCRIYRDDSVVDGMKEMIDRLADFIGYRLHIGCEDKDASVCDRLYCRCLLSIFTTRCTYHTPFSVLLRLVTPITLPSQSWASMPNSSWTSTILAPR
jgi:hypothetical protein